MNLTQFVRLFPILEPPLTLTEESIFTFSKENKLINPETAQTYFSQFEKDYDEGDDIEYVPCFRLSISDKYHSLVYWRASALNYEYYLVNINKKGEMLDRKLISGVIVQSESILRLVVSIDVNYIFFIAGSIADDSDRSSATPTETYSLEVFPDGTIVSS